jgi:hypothetical protein
MDVYRIVRYYAVIEREANPNRTLSVQYVNVEAETSLVEAHGKIIMAILQVARENK